MSEQMCLPRDIPYELLDRIFLQLDEPRDLLAAALASKVLRDMIIPSHLEYRRISCNLCSPAVWEEVLSLETLAASQIRSLYIIPDRDYTDSLAVVYPATSVPKRHRLLVNEYSDDIDEGDSLPQVISAIKCMRLLKRFCWLATYRPMSSIFQALYTSCPELHEVEVVNWNGPGDTSYMSNHDLGDFKLWSLSNLSRFSYSQTYLSGDRETYLEFISQLVDMLLHRCPGLQDLQLFFNYFYHGFSIFPPQPIQEMFDSATWPNLKRLTVEACTLPSDITAFCARHPNIEALCITDRQDPEMDLSHLHHLYSLDLDWVPALHHLSPKIANNILHFDGMFRGVHQIEEKHLKDAFLSRASNLNSLVLRLEEFDTETVKRLVQYVPTVRRLALIFQWSRYDTFLPEDEAEHKAAYTTILMSLPNLTHFSPVYLENWSPWQGGDDDESEEDHTLRIDDTLKAILEIVPNLRFAGIKSDNLDNDDEDPIWVTLEIGQDGEYRGFTWADRHRLRRDVEVESWGDVYYGAGKDLIHRWYDEF